MNSNQLLYSFISNLFAKLWWCLIMFNFHKKNNINFPPIHLINSIYFIYKSIHHQFLHIIIIKYLAIILYIDLPTLTWNNKMKMYNFLYYFNEPIEGWNLNEEMANWINWGMNLADMNNWPLNWLEASREGHLQRICGITIQEYIYYAHWILHI